MQTGLEASLIHQALVETSLLGWKELEYEVLRDGAGNCIIVCNMENIDPVGVHTGDSIVVAPSQTLSDLDYQMLRTSSINVIRALNVQGGCNIQFALHPDSSEYMIIEVNPRVSRSSALASKATGYPIAKISTKIALGQTLDVIPNPVTGGRTKAAYEPTLDYCVVKIPRWPFDKFPLADTRLGTQMKSTGEAMGIGRTFAAALMKAVRGLDLKFETLTGNAFADWSDDELLRTLQPATHERLFAVCELLRRGRTVDELHALSTIDEFWLWELKALVELEEAFRAHAAPGPLFGQAPPDELVRRALESGYSVARHQLAVRRRARGAPATDRGQFRMVDTAAAEFPATLAVLLSLALRERRDARPRRTKRSSSSAAARSASGRGSSSTTSACTPRGRCATRGARRSSSTTTPRRCRPTSTSATCWCSSRRAPTRSKRRRARRTRAA